VQGEMAAGTRIEFKVSVELIGLIIGKKGVRVKEIQEDTGVTSIHIDGTTGSFILIFIYHNLFKYI